MSASEIRVMIRDEVNRVLNVILQGVSEEQTQAEGDLREGIGEMFPGMPTVTDRPVAHPYGMISRAPRGTLSVHARQGNHFGNRIVLAHRDKNRPDIERGEVMLYNEYGQQIYLRNGSVRLGNRTAAHPVALGDKVTSEFSTLLTTLLAHTHLIITPLPGSPTSPPDPAALLAFTTQKATIQAGSVNSAKVFTE